MDENKFSSTLAENDSKEIVKLIGQAITEISKNTKCDGLESIQKLTERLDKEKSYNDQIREQIRGKRKKVDWSASLNRLNRVDCERIWQNIDANNTDINRDHVYRLHNENDGEHLKGLKEDMTEQEVKNLIQAQQNKSMQPMGASKRSRFNDEQRCIQKRYGEVHWYSSLKDFKRHAESLRYTQNQTKQMILEAAKDALPEFDNSLNGLTLEELSKHLIDQDPIEYEESQYLRPLKLLKRRVDVPLNTVAKNAERLYKLAFKKEDANCDPTSMNFDQQLLQFNIDTLVKLVNPEVAKAIKNHIHSCKTKGKNYTYAELLQGAISFEETDPNMRPKTELQLDYMSPQDELSVKLNNLAMKYSKTEYNSDSSEDSPIFTNKYKRYARPPTPIKGERPKPTHTKDKKQDSPANSRQQQLFVQQPTGSDYIERSPTANMQDSPLNQSSVSVRISRVKLSEAKAQSSFEQAKIDFEELTVFYKQDFDIVKKRVAYTVNKYYDDNQLSAEQIYKETLDKLKTKNWTTRVIGAVIYNILNTIHRIPNMSDKKRFDTVMYFLDKDIRQTRSTSGERVQINSYTGRQVKFNERPYRGRQNYRNDRQRDRSSSRATVGSRDSSRSTHRSFSRDRYRTPSSDRGQQYYRQHNNYDRQSRYNRDDRQKNQRQYDNYTRQRSSSRENNDQYKYRQRDRTPSSNIEYYKKSDDRQDRYTRKSPRNEYYDKRNRDSSKGNRRYNSDRRTQSREYSSNRSYNRDNRRDNSRGNDKRQNNRYRQKSISPFTAQKMQRGHNCPDSYNPADRYCSKCNDSSHHPWNCQKYSMNWKRNNCRICERGFHDEEECKNMLREKLKN